VEFGLALRALVFPPGWLLSVATAWTRLRGVCLIGVVSHFHSGELGFVLGHAPEFAEDPLVHTLVLLSPVVQVVTDVSDVAEDKRRGSRLE
jgi:hypothetical protein